MVLRLGIFFQIIFVVFALDHQVYFSNVTKDNVLDVGALFSGFRLLSADLVGNKTHELMQNVNPQCKRDLGLYLGIIATANFTKNPWALKNEGTSNFIYSFSLIKNWTEPVIRSEEENHLAMLDGLRIITQFIIIQGHMKLILSTSNFINGRYLTYSDYSYDAILTSTFSAVDIFLSATYFILGFSIAKKINQGFSAIYRDIVFQSLRYLVSTIILLYFIVPITPYFMDGPNVHRIQSFLYEKCRGNEWTFLTFLSPWILHNEEYQCQSHLWLLATEIQLTVIAPLFISLWYKYPKGTKVLTILSIIVVSCQQWYLGYLHNISLDPFTVTYHSIQTQIRPYYRMTIWATSLIAGTYTYKQLFTEKKPLSKRKLTVGWVLWSIACAVSMYLSWSHLTIGGTEQISAQYAATVTLIKTFLLPFVLLWIYYTMAHGHAGFLKNILSNPTLLSLGKYNLGVYVYHISYLGWKYNQNMASFIYSQNLKLRHIVPDLFLLYAFAFLMDLVFELPIMAIILGISNKFWMEKPK